MILLLAGSSQGLNDNNRIALYTIAMRSIFESPLLGYGYGTFADVFPMFRDQSMSTFDTWALAHNTYLEVFQGLGLLFGSMLVASIALLAQRCVKGAMNRQENEIRLHCGRRCLSRRGPFVGRLQPADPGRRGDVYGLAGGGCRAIPEFSADARGLRVKPTSAKVSPPTRLRHFLKSLQKNSVRL